MAPGVKKAKPKVKQDPKSKLHICNEMSALDCKDRDYFDNLSEEEKKKFSTYTMIRWGSSVASTVPWYASQTNRESLNPEPLNQASADVQVYYLLSANERLNKHYFDISSTAHKKLLWLLATTISPGIGKFSHEWIPGVKDINNNKAEKFLRALNPTMKEDEIELLARINTIEDLRELAKAHGWDNKQIKAEL